MCLYSRQILPRRATKDIVCYKLFKKKTRRKKKNGRIAIRYQSPFQCDHFYGSNMLNTVLHAKTTIRHNKPYWNQTSKTTRVESGYFHAYQTARNYYTLLITAWKNIVLLKCIIPKGALYYKGVNGDICANQMIFIEEINI